MGDTATTNSYWDFPYPSRRSPVLARNCVATAQPLAAQAGLSMLAKGGNAVDAAVATAITLTVVEPTGNGLGSDLFAILWDGAKLVGLNASGRSPAAWHPERFAGSAMPHEGWNSATIPGAVAAWVELSRRYRKLPFATLVEPAIRYASDGFLVSPIIAQIWKANIDRLKDQPGFADAFMPRGRAPTAGRAFQSTRYGRRRSQRSPRRRAKISIAARSRPRSLAPQGTMAASSARTTWPRTRSTSSIRSTSSSTAIASTRSRRTARASARSSRSAYWSAARSPASRRTVPRCSTSRSRRLKLGVADVRDHVADIGHMTVTPEELLDPARLDELARGIAPRSRRRPAATLHESRRHRLSRRRRPGRHDGFAHPVELSQLRRRRGCAGHGNSAQQSWFLLPHRYRSTRTVSARASGRSTPSSPASSPRMARRSPHSG